MRDKFEYSIRCAGALLHSNELNDMGLEGWELISIVQLHTTFVHYFKRKRI